MYKITKPPIYKYELPILTNSTNLIDNKFNIIILPITSKIILINPLNPLLSLQMILIKSSINPIIAKYKKVKIKVIKDLLLNDLKLKRINGSNVAIIKSKPPKLLNLWVGLISITSIWFFGVDAKNFKCNLHKIKQDIKDINKQKINFI